MEARSYNRTAIAAGLLFVVLGVVFLLEQLNVFDLRAVYVWPVVLIVLGAAILASGVAASRRGG
jgi:drug/metabolite transporter (DMT)-like permease